MNTWLNYHHLYYFKVIASEGGIARAAQKLRLGQPTLSAQLKIFEETIGVQLFERKHKKLILTEGGRVALQYANEIFKIGNEMLEVLHDKGTSSKIHVQIGALDGVSKRVTNELVKAAYLLGNCRVSLLEGKGDELIRELTHHRIDLFISNYLPSTHEAVGLFSRSIAKFPVNLYGSPQFRNLKKNFPQSLNDISLVVPTVHSKLRHDIEHYFKTSGINFNPIVETQDTSLQIQVGLEGLGLIPISTFTAEPYVKSGELVEMGRLNGVVEEYYLVAASRRIENPISSQIMKSFKLKL